MNYRDYWDIEEPISDFSVRARFNKGGFVSVTVESDTVDNLKKVIDDVMSSVRSYKDWDIYTVPNLMGTRTYYAVKESEKSAIADENYGQLIRRIDAIEQYSSERFVVNKLEALNIAGKGSEIYAYFPDEVNCIEFCIRSDKKCILIGYAPWIQFAPRGWDQTIEHLFEQMVDAWNEKYGSGALKPGN